MFKDRHDAGRQLAKRLEHYRGTHAVVLALPRGGVILGYEVAKALGAPLDILVPRKIGHPLHPEYAIGAVDEKGTRILSEMEAATLDPKWLEAETERQQKEAKRRVSTYRGTKAGATIKGKIVILIDDGIATGLTMRLAVRSVKAQTPQKIIVAVPVAPSESIAELKAEGADAVIVLEPPQRFAGAVGAHYLHFDQVEDEEVILLLQSLRML